jgi:diguanylate cyclase (GGDEF)-like protein
LVNSWSDALAVALVAGVAIAALVALLLRSRKRLRALELRERQGPLVESSPDLRLGSTPELNEAWSRVLREITLSGHGLFWESDAHHRYKRVYQRDTALGRDDFEWIIGKTPWELPSIGVSAADWSRLQMDMDGHLPFHDFVVGRVDPQGRLRYGALSGVPVADAQGLFSGYNGASRDVTILRQTQVQLEIKDAVTRNLASHGRLSEAMPGILESICKPLGWLYGARWMRDPRDGNLVCGEIWAAPVAQPLADESRSRKLPCLREDLLGTAWHTQAIAWMSDAPGDPGFARAAAAAESNLHAAFAFPVVVQGDVVCLLELFGPYVQQMDDVIDSVAQSVGHQISLFWLRREAEARLTYAATHDALTGLRNRLAFNAELEKAIARSRRNDWRAALLFIDLDGFKQVNDTMGHAAGDTLLIGTARRLKATVRASDTVARLGGDEFVVLLEQAGSDGDIADVAHKLARTLGGPYAEFNDTSVVAASIGIAIFPVDAAEPMDLLARADAAMYKAKESSGSRVVFYRPPPGERTTYNRSPEGQPATDGGPPAAAESSDNVDNG